MSLPIQVPPKEPIVSSPVGSPTLSSPINNIFQPEKLLFPRKQIKVLLLEGIHEDAVKKLQWEEFQIESLKISLKGEELKKKLSNVHVLGIRSKTKVTKEILDAAPNLLCIGCFCIGTDQVDLTAAQNKGIPVFNSPFCNSRSVAELIIAQIITLARKLGDRNREMHSGTWNKTSANCYEIRGKVLGIVGYGHIGSQLSVLAEAMGMRVVFYDIRNVMPLGNSLPLPTLEELLKRSDFVTLHVPETPQTKNMIGAKELNLMRKGAYLLNASRGSVVVISDLVKALKSGQLNGAYVDVYPVEPSKNNCPFQNELQNCPNTILTPHIGGSTLEAQQAIGEEVAGRVISFIMTGNTMGAVNFPQIDVPYGGPTTHRVLNVHYNHPGVLKVLFHSYFFFHLFCQVDISFVSGD
eukprot:TRINITY_DN4930_c0_g4_i1.p1 TRINITY_DN4930_c0_g4~~TRINITY_DN4930_c0_g4_i1.p1  ORF type:complete len:424 (+),score=52.52 TRINITY_DN4930_c0_g4_i1:46-1272(+)